MTTRRGCPIVDACVRYLRSDYVSKRVRDLYPEYQDEISRFLDVAESLSDEPRLVRLRGFVAIESMLKDCLAQELPKRQMEVIELDARSWVGLTLLGKKLQDLITDIEINDAEFKLAGGRVRQHDSTTRVWVPSKANALSAVRTISEDKVAHIAKVIRRAVATLRPYLRNERVPVSRIAHCLTECYKLSHGIELASLVGVINKMLEAEL